MMHNLPCLLLLLLAVVFIIGPVFIFGGVQAIGLYGLTNFVRFIQGGLQVLSYRKYLNDKREVEDLTDTPGQKESQFSAKRKDKSMVRADLETMKLENRDLTAQIENRKRERVLLEAARKDEKSKYDLLRAENEALKDKNDERGAENKKFKELLSVKERETANLERPLEEERTKSVMLADSFSQQKGDCCEKLQGGEGEKSKRGEAAVTRESGEIEEEEEEGGGGGGGELPSIERVLEDEVIKTKAFAAPQKVSVMNFVVIRHAERLDLKSCCCKWTLRNILRYYEDCDPGALPQRLLMHDYLRDSPLTIRGIVKATFIGLNMLEKGFVPCAIYCSPAIRCVQTARAIARGAGILQTHPIHIEPGLFERRRTIPATISRAEYEANGYYNIARNYRPCMRVNWLPLGESKAQFHCRQAEVAAHILRHASTIKAARASRSACVLMVTHRRNVGSVSHVLMKQEKCARRREYRMARYLFHEMVMKRDCGWERSLLPFSPEEEREKVLKKIKGHETMGVHRYPGWRFVADDEWDVEID